MISIKLNIFAINGFNYMGRGEGDMLQAKELNIAISINIQSLLPFLQPFLVESVGIGVTSSILPILIPLRAIALSAD